MQLFYICVYYVVYISRVESRIKVFFSIFRNVAFDLVKKVFIYTYIYLQVLLLKGNNNINCSV